ncbi:hypothetical protein K439DRAFT_1648918 [Ramaria rubella]|nr:hypothetical protein K439DRAFT_1648918 [Ramaria rubella]
MWWQPPKDPKGPAQHVYSNLCSSTAFHDSHREVNFDLTFCVPGCHLENIVAALMIWSDSTHLTQFGTAHLWPIYVFPGNMANWFRACPTSHSCEHWAYIPSLPDNLQDFIQEICGGQAATGALLTHCQREFIQAVWALLLDKEFMAAYKQGIVIQCADGILRRVFLHLFTYSADYPENSLHSPISYGMLMLSLRDKGNCPCPRCLVTKKEICELGLQRHLGDVNLARRFIYEKTGYKVNSTAVNNLLQPKSLVPTENTFSKRLTPDQFNKYLMFVVGLMHEFELGVWKAVFIHLIRLLSELGPDRVNELNKRYRQIPTSGRDTIGRFTNNVYEMKKLAARDFEDILQCAMPAFEGLFPEPHETIIQRLLFVMASWHSLAKLRMHTDSTLHQLDTLTTQLGQALRKFAGVTCRVFVTHELPRETAARARRAAKKAMQQQQASASSSRPNPIIPPTPQRKAFNMSTPKLHFLGDYVSTIKQFGTTDLYSTQTGELEHRRSKRRYGRVSKATPALGMTKIDRRETHMRQISTQVGNAERYHISPSQEFPLDLGRFLREHQGDAAVKNFYNRLKDHLLARMRGLEYDGDETEFTEQDRDTVIIRSNRLYRHQTCLHARDDPANTGYHPFWYARVIGIFHVNVKCTSNAENEWATIPFIWPIHPRRYDRIGFVTESDDTEPFGFLDPANVVRACHLIPAFADGRTNDLLGPSVARPEGENDNWTHYYVNRFVDRDMAMRFSGGGGVGHSIHYSLHASADDPMEGVEGQDSDLHGQDQESAHDHEDASVGLEELETGDSDGDEDTDGTETTEEDDEQEDDDDVAFSDNGYGSA